MMAHLPSQQLLMRAAALAGLSRRCPSGFRPLSTSSPSSPSPSYFPVVVVGAGPTGATLAALLARLGVRCLLLERSPVAGRAHPAAHFVNARTMETFRRLPVVAAGFGGGEEEEEGEGGRFSASSAAKEKDKRKATPTKATTTTSVAAAVAAACPPRDQWRRFVYCGSAVNGPLLASVDHFEEEEKEEERERARKRRERERRGAAAARGGAAAAAAAAAAGGGG